MEQLEPPPRRGHGGRSCAQGATGSDLVVLGSGELVQTLMHHGLVDEYVLLIHPLVLGSGRRLFSAAGARTALRLVDDLTVDASPSGVLITTITWSAGDDREARSREQPAPLARRRSLADRHPRRVRARGDVPRVRGRGRDHEDDRVEAGRPDPRRGLSAGGRDGQAITEVVVVGPRTATSDRPRRARESPRSRTSSVARVRHGSSPTARTGASSRRTATRRSSSWPSAGTGRTTSSEVVDVGSAPRRRARLSGGGNRRRTADADEDAASLEDLKKGELFFGAPLALVVLLLVFGAVVAGLVPLMLAIASIVVALALVALLAQAYDLSVFTQNMLIGMGLALGIDYSLFTLSRYREERLQGREKLDAIATAGATAGRAVLFSGIAFVLAMLGPPARSEHDLPQPRRRRDPGRDRLRDRRADAAPRRPRAARRPRECASHPLLRTRGRAGGPGGPLLGRDRRPGHASPRREPRARRRPAARARRPRARARHGHLGGGDAARPLRVEAGLPPPPRGVPEGVDRAGRDRGRRRRPRARRGRRSRPARARARAPADLRGADRRGERGRHGRPRHVPSRAIRTASARSRPSATFAARRPPRVRRGRRRGVRRRRHGRGARLPRHRELLASRSCSCSCSGSASSC